MFCQVRELPLSRHKRFLDRSVYENALDFRLLGGGLNNGGVLRGPNLRIDVLAVVRDHVDSRHFFALLTRELTVRHRRKPDIGIETDLVAGMAGKHRAAARLRHVADQ